MIGSPDLLAFTTETDFLEQSTDSVGLPADLSVPLYPLSEDTSPWSKASSVSFGKDFILISEFSEQVGPQPLLTIPEEIKCGSFDVNNFSIRIMSVDYQSIFASPVSCGHPKLNFVEDSKVVLGDSREGAYAYVHHLTLYDLEARGFVRPFCMAYVSAEVDKLMHCFRSLSAEFSKASDWLKTGNRKNFANEVEKKLSDLEYTRLILLREINRDRLRQLNFGDTKSVEIKIIDKGSISEMEKNKNSELMLNTKEEELKEKQFVEACENSNMPDFDKRGSESQFNLDVLSNDIQVNRESEKSQVFEQKPTETKQCQSATCPSKLSNIMDELAHVEKSIREHRSLLKQVTSYPNRKVRDPEFLPYEPEDAFHSLESDQDANIMDSQSAVSVKEQIDCSSAPLHKPQLVTTNMTRRFDKRLKNLDELCDEYFLQQALKQLHFIQKNFRGNYSNLISQQRSQNLLHHLTSTNFLFEDLSDLEAEASQQIYQLQPQPALLHPVSPLQSEPVSLDSYTSCVEMVPIRLELHRNGTDLVSTSPCDDPLSKPNFLSEDNCKTEDVSMTMKDSISSGESIEVLGMEKSLRTQGPVCTTDTVPQRQVMLSTTTFEVRKRRVVTQRENSEDSIEVLSTIDYIIPDDLRAAYPSAIYEETPEHEGQENECMNSTEDILIQCKNKHKECQCSPSTPSIILNTQDPHMSLDLHTFFAHTSLSEPGFLQHKPFQFTPDEFSDCTSSHGSTGSLLSLNIHSENSTCSSRRKHSTLGRAALKFLSQFPFAVHAVYSLLSGRTLVVLGSEEKVVRQLVGALTMYTPRLAACRGNILPWTSSPLQITDLLRWKLIGINRSAFPSMPLCLVRFSRYLSILDVDQKTLRCPAYKGALICPLVERRTHTMRGTTYFLYVQSIISQLVSSAYLLTFTHGKPNLSNPIAEVKPEYIFSKFHSDDLKILKYISELITQHINGTSSTVLRFSYTASMLFKL